MTNDTAQILDAAKYDKFIVRDYIQPALAAK